MGIQKVLPKIQKQNQKPPRRGRLFLFSIYKLIYKKLMTF